MYIYKVAPKSKTKIQDNYDYLSEEPLETGTIVKIELGKSKVFGVIIGQSHDKRFASKKISGRISGGSAFTTVQIDLAKKLQDEYLTALGETIFAFLPTMNVSDIKKLGTLESKQKKHKLKSELFISSLSNRLSYYTELTSRTNGQVLIVLPEIEQIDNLYKNLKKILPHKKIFCFYSSIKSDKKRIIWNEMLKGSDGIIISTRQGLLLPFTNLALLCIDDPLNFAYQEDQAPYYQAFFVARKLKDISGCALTIGESVPDICSYIAYKNKRLSIKTVKSDLKISSTSEFRKFDQNISLLNKIENALASRERVCFIGPWLSQIRLVCSDCKKDISCRSCGKDHFDQDSLACVSCGVEATSCPNCASPKVRSVGFSYKSIEEQIAKAIPNYKNQITQNPNHFRENQIIIASPNEILESRVDFQIAIFPYFDKMIDFAALGYRHKIFRLIFDLAKLSISQVYLCGEDLADNEFAAKIIGSNWEEFLLSELTSRNKIKLPPFSKSVEIVCKTKDQDLAQKQFNMIAAKLDVSITMLRHVAEERFARVKGLFFVENSAWPNIKKKIKDLNLRNCHFEIDRGEYL